MKRYFLDTSALVKIYHREDGSDFCLELYANHSQIVISELARVEFCSAVYVEELGKLAAGLSMTGAGKNRLFLEKRIAEARVDLSRAEDALKAFQTKNKAVSVIKLDPVDSSERLNNGGNSQWHYPLRFQKMYLNQPKFPELK